MPTMSGLSSDSYLRPSAHAHMGALCRLARKEALAILGGHTETLLEACGSHLYLDKFSARGRESVPLQSARHDFLAGIGAS